MSLRVLHCPTDVGGSGYYMAKGERAVGLDSRAVALTASPMGTMSDVALAGPTSPRWRIELGRLQLLKRALFDCDVVHFNYGRSILPIDHRLRWRAEQAGGLRKAMVPVADALMLADLPLLKRAGKIIAVTYQGDDVRQGDRLPAGSLRDFVADDYFPPYSDDSKRRAAAKFGRYADLMFSTDPILLRMLPRHAEFMVTLGVDLDEIEPAQPRTEGPIVIAHAPTARRVKGTDLIISAVERLQAEGCAVELMLVEGLPQKEARLRYRSADLLADQLHVGCFGSLTQEFMAMGKPVACNFDDHGYRSLAHPGFYDELPVANIGPHDVYEVLKDLVTGPRERLLDMGRRGRAFMEKWYALPVVGARLRTRYGAAIAARGRK
jgi:glycosyltransferase involved in cell wall biosynthesis